MYAVFPDKARSEVRKIMRMAHGINFERLLIEISETKQYGKPKQRNNQPTGSFVNNNK